MTLATTSSIWRSTGGDQTRTAYAGSMHMAATFYIANTSATSNVVVSSASNAPALILPANAVVTDVIITTGSTGANSTCNIGFTPLVGGTGPGQSPTLGTNVPNGLVSNANLVSRGTISVGSTGQGTSLGNACNSTNLVVLTSAIGTAGAVGGPVTGIIQYFVLDGIYGNENV
jgi:hypothetical protein